MKFNENVNLFLNKHEWLKYFPVTFQSTMIWFSFVQDFQKYHFDVLSDSL